MLLQPGQAFVIHMQTDVEDPDRVSGAALAVTDAPDHILVSSRRRFARGMPCGVNAGGCGDAGICEFYGTCVAPDPVPPDNECLDSCAEEGYACGIHPTVADCVCPNTCDENTACQGNDCVGPATDCMGPQDCELNEDCMDGSCNRIACGDMLPCPTGTSCVSDFCELGCSLGDPWWGNAPPSQVDLPPSA